MFLSGSVVDVRDVPGAYELSSEEQYHQLADKPDLLSLEVRVPDASTVPFIEGEEDILFDGEGGFTNLIATGNTINPAILAGVTVHEGPDYN
jgi:hypothetical protein